MNRKREEMVMFVGQLFGPFFVVKLRFEGPKQKQICGLTAKLAEMSLQTNGSVTGWHRNLAVPSGEIKSHTVRS